jgi:hypothetical protein
LGLGKRKEFDFESLAQRHGVLPKAGQARLDFGRKSLVRPYLPDRAGRDRSQKKRKMLLPEKSGSQTVAVKTDFREGVPEEANAWRSFPELETVTSSARKSSSKAVRSSHSAG